MQPADQQVLNPFLFHDPFGCLVKVILRISFLNASKKIRKIRKETNCFETQFYSLILWNHGKNSCIERGMFHTKQVSRIGNAICYAVNWPHSKETDQGTEGRMIGGSP
jgi:hypothetical protein